MVKFRSEEYACELHQRGAGNAVADGGLLENPTVGISMAYQGAAVFLLHEARSRSDRFAKRLHLILAIQR